MSSRKSGLARRWVVAAMVGVGLCVWPIASADAKTERVHRGDVEATLSYQPRSDFGYRSSLAIEVAGTLLLDEPVVGLGCEDRCIPFTFGQSALHVVDLGGNPEPEVLVRLYSGGAHCCHVVQVFERGPDGYRLAQRDFGNVSARVFDLDDDGSAELRTGDNRFAYRFTSYAGSVFPLQVFEFEQGRLVDRTPSYSRLLRPEAAKLWRLYRRFRGRGGDVRGIFAAWAADAARLGRSRLVKRALTEGVRRGWLTAPGRPDGRPYARKLWRFLGRIGYRQTSLAATNAELASVSPVFLPDCGISFYGGRVEPRRWDRGCTTGIDLLRMTWRRWGRRAATGEGQTALVDCDPDCARGQVYVYPARARVSRIRRCKGRSGRFRRFYTRIRLTYELPEGNPFDQPPGDWTNRYALGCTK